MTDINRVILVGRLVKDAELKFTSASTPVTRFSVAVNRSRKNGDQWEEEVSYIDIVLWGRSAESISKFLTKGKQVAVEGELRQNRWEQDGQQRSKLEVVASNVQLLSGGTATGGGNAQPQGQQGSFAKKSAPQSAPEPDHFDDDGIPF
ncbi:MAG: single-stranded DNA-binding protein [Spirochaetia bacterium]|nr:single-stranded DNA-binding protein [Spirochaetia bacterium]MBO7429491.1 single-stranded DNA-binding protein [Spirochaetia bacterium]MBO7516162.1 single-stranded DNA-binding protein [Spirochaetia bacterium]